MKPLKFLGAVAAVNTLSAVGLNAIDQSSIGTRVIGLPVMGMLPGLGASVLDYFVNSKITTNKAIQYGLTAIESIALTSLVSGITANDLSFSIDTLKKIFSPDIEQDADIKLYTLDGVLQSLACKFILDAE